MNEFKIKVISSSWVAAEARAVLAGNFGNSIEYIKARHLKMDSLIQELRDDKKLFIIFYKNLDIEYYNKFTSRALNKNVYDQLFVYGFDTDRLKEILKRVCYEN